MKKQRYEPLEQRVLHFIQKHRLVTGQKCLLVAVSGGQDSVCLLHILVKLRGKLGLELHVAHLNHQLRGAEAEADAQHVSQLAQQLDIPATIERRDVKAEQVRRHISLEEAAREVRYDFLSQVARSIETNLIAVGHTSDDHIETILMHLIRGTGIRGLRGLQPSSRLASDNTLTVIRPLLEVSRQETADYCHSHHLKPRIDTSNLSLSTLRNRIRLQLLPGLKDYNPRINETLLRLAQLATDDLAFLEQEGSRLWNRVAREQRATVILDKAEFNQLQPALQRHILRMAIERLITSLKDIEARHIEEIIEALAKPAGKRLNLPRGLTFTIEYDRYLLSLEPSALTPLPPLGEERTLKIPGETLLSGWSVTATILSATEAKRKLTKSREDGFSAYLDFDRVGSKLIVRNRQPGDRFQPLGLGQPKKLGEFMIDAKIPRHWRQRVPLVCSPQQILWVVGWQIDDSVKVTESTKRVLFLKFEHTASTDNQAESTRQKPG